MSRTLSYQHNSGFRETYTFDQGGDVKELSVLLPNDVDYLETLGSRFLSFYNIAMMNKHYRCFDRCKNFMTTCENRGPKSSENSKCRGATVSATQEYQDLLITLGNVNKAEEEEFERCFFWIESPPNTQLEVRVAGLNGTYPNDGCPYAEVELKMRLTDGKPGPTPSTPKPKFTFNTLRGWKCEDQSICNIIKSTVCDPKSLTYDTDKKARTCPKACGLC
ncbi:hypothetical protein Q1695_005501 [Nippostrongylus brasiliensis]|nr:hypothetical protein Q1695_005501 [Nippostrongylus brasiliensis]